MAGIIDFLFPKKPKKGLPRIDLTDKPLPPEALGTGGARKAADELKNRKKKLDDALKDMGA